MVDASGASLLLRLVYGDKSDFITDVVPVGVAASALVFAELVKAERIKEMVFEANEPGFDDVVLLIVDDPSATMDRTANQVLDFMNPEPRPIPDALVLGSVPVFGSEVTSDDSLPRLRAGMSDVVLGKRQGSYAELSVLSVLSAVYNPHDLFGEVTGLKYTEEIASKIYSRSHVWSDLGSKQTQTVNSILSELFGVTYAR